MRIDFESTIEKVGRILARQYGINVVFEGDQAMTDGKTIYLPQFDELSDDLKADLHGFLDHEVAHCKFTEFPEIGKCKTSFHKNLLNAVEDTRIEREMVNELPGTQLNLDPLNKKYRGKMMESWDKIPAPMRIIVGIRNMMEGRPVENDADIKSYLDAVKDQAIALNDAKTTTDLRVGTQAIVDLISTAREKEKKKEDKKKEGKKSAKGKPGEDGKGESGKGGKPGDKPGKGGSPSPDMPGDEFDKLMSEKVGDKKPGESEFDKHVTDAHGLIDKEIKDAIKEGKRPSAKVPGGALPTSREFDSRPHLAMTTRFDKITDHSGKGDRVTYSRLRKDVQKLVGSIKRTLERTLKVQENARWKGERERGRIDARQLGRLASDMSYRTPFREFIKTETNNVAVEILVDMSGSMHSRMATAKKSVIAMGEALKELDIPFEVTGFFSTDDDGMSRMEEKMGDVRYNRSNERLDLHVFKSFRCTNLNGLEKLFVGHENPDGEAVRWAAKRLAEQKQKRKVLMVFSDGYPSTGDGNREILNADLKRSVEQIQRSGIEVIGVGIQTRSVQAFYPENVMIDDVKDLPKKTMTKLSQILTRRRVG